MQIFSRLNVCFFVFLGVTLLLVGSTDVHAQEPSLSVAGDIGKVYQVNDIVETIFTARDAFGDPVVGVTLDITYTGLTGVTISNGGVTDFVGAVRVRGEIISLTSAFIEAVWRAEQLSAIAPFDIYIRDVPEAVFHRYSTTFRHPDVHKFFPDVLRAFKDPEIQEVLNSVVIHHFVRDPEYIRAFYPDVDEGIITLLATDNGFRTLFEDEGFQGVLQEPAEIDELVRLIEAQPPQEPGTLTIVSGDFVVGFPSLTQTFTAAATIEDVGKSPALIVVNSPSNTSELKIGDTFTQMISIENRGNYSTLRLSAWQMDVVYNPLIFEVVEVTEGDFLESDGEDAVYAAMIGSGKISVWQTRAGQMANAAKAPSPAGIALAPGEKGELLTITFKILAVAEEPLGIHNVRLQSDQDDDEDGTPDRISYSILITDVAVATHQSSEPVDVNQDGYVNILDLVMVSGSLGMVPGNPRADVNGDGFVNVLDLITIYKSDHWANPEPLPSEKISAANEPTLTAPSVSRNLDPATIQSWIDLAEVEDDGSAIFDLGIANFEALLASRIPSETRLLLNYPNPFNPETWIPYQLAEATEVTVMIHAMNGSLIRMLELGHQSAGTYKSKSQAAYWDGRNELGEQVASGLYFYTLTAGDFTATRKMLIRK